VLNPRYVSTSDYLAGRSHVRMEPPPGEVDLDVNLAEPTALGPLRASLAAWSKDRGFAAQAVDDVLLAATEIATNALRHGAPPVRVRGWYRRDVLVVQVDDSGGTAPPPGAGYAPPDKGSGSGRGLWIARQLADAVTIQADGTRTTVRLHFPHDLTHRGPAD
jgi:anti-sigma regulatory factor (Ser/Thr protein kinase)